MIRRTIPGWYLGPGSLPALPATTQGSGHDNDGLRDGEHTANLPRLKEGLRKKTLAPIRTAAYAG